MNDRLPLGHARLLFCLLFLLACQTGCKQWTERGAKGVGLLPKASPNETKFSSYQPANPYGQIVTGLLGRKLYSSPPEAGAVIEVNDFLVGPNQHTASYTLPATAIFEVRSGSGSLTVAGKSQPLETGAVVPVPGSQPFTIENKTEVPLRIRAQVLGGK